MGVGADWAVMKPGRNNERLTPYQKYNDTRMVASDIAEHLINRTVNRFGYGADDKPLECEKHFAQQYSVGRITWMDDFVILFTADIRPGDSGSALLLWNDATAVGIITHRTVGCPNIAQRLDDIGVILVYRILCRCPGDVNGDFTVDDADLLRVLLLFGRSDCWGCPEDLDNDGVIDDADLLGVLSNFGECE